MMRMEDWVLWNSERASGEVVEVSWWELTTLFCHRFVWLSPKLMELASRE
jgi:hypothetical protein